MIKAVILDIDGVIADTEPIHEKVWRSFFKLHGVLVSNEDLKNMKGKSGVAVVKIFLPHITSDKEAQELRDERAELFMKELKNNINEVSGFSNFFTQLKSRNIKIAVATSAEKSRADVILEKIGINGKIDALITAKDVINGKPSPDIFLKAAEKLKVSASNCIVFEDSKSGIQAANAAGMTSVLIMTTHKKDELDDTGFAFNDFTEIDLDNLLTSK